MRRSVIKFLAAASVVTAAASPAFAASKPIVSTLPAPVAPCDVTLPAPDALDCAGYFSGNLINGTDEDIANQLEAIAELDGDFVWDGNWAAVEDTKILSLVDGNKLDFGTTLFGQTIIGLHFGNVSGDAGNVSVFWLFDFGDTGADFIVLDDPTGFSNAVLYTTGTPVVPEPATWAMMLLGFGAAGAALRRSRRRTPRLAQLA